MANRKKLLITLAKISLSLLFIGFLFWWALKRPEDRVTFRGMLLQPKVWSLLFDGLAALLLVVVITIVRWCFLVRALGIDLSMRDAMRIGFIGYLFNLAPMGIVGGDLLKAWMLAREKPGNRAKALASVVVNRIVGLYVLFLVATGVSSSRAPGTIPTQTSIGFVAQCSSSPSYPRWESCSSCCPDSSKGRGALADADPEDRSRDREPDRGDPHLSQQAASALFELASDDSGSRFPDAFDVLAGHGTEFRPGAFSGVFRHLPDQRHCPNDSAPGRAGGNGNRLLLQDGVAAGNSGHGGSGDCRAARPDSCLGLSSEHDPDCTDRRPPIISLAGGAK